MLDGPLTRRRFLQTAAGGLGLAGVPGLMVACGAGGRPAAQSPSGNVAPKRGGRLKAAFIGGSNESPKVTQATQTALGYVRARSIWDPLGELVNGKPEWRLAEAVESNRDATEWTVRIRKGITFHSGKPLTSADVAFTLKTLVDQQALQAAFLQGIDFAGVRTPDTRTLVLPLKQPNGLLDLILALSIFVFPEGTSDLTRAEGTGPFLDVSYTPGQGALMKRNDNYWGAANGGPYLDELELVNVVDATARMNGLESGQFDYAASVPLTVARTERGNGALQLLMPPQDLWSDVGLLANVGQAPFTTPEVVEALRYSVDRESLVKTVTLGFGEVGNDLLCKHDPYYDSALKQRSYDPDRAKQLLKRAGHSGLKLNLRTSDYDYGMLETATAWIGQAKNAGITVSLDKVPANDYYSDFKALLSAPLQMMVLGLTPLAICAVYYYGSQAYFPVTGLGATVDPLVDAVRVAITEERRAAALTELQRFLYERAGHIIPNRIPNVAAATPRVHGVKPQGFAAFPTFRDAFLA